MPATSEARRCQVTIRDSGPLSRHPARTGDGRHLRRQEWAERAPHRPSGQCHDPRDKSRRPSPDQAWRHRSGPRRTGRRRCPGRARHALHSLTGDRRCQVPMDDEPDQFEKKAGRGGWQSRSPRKCALRQLSGMLPRSLRGLTGFRLATEWPLRRIADRRHFVTKRHSNRVSFGHPCRAVVRTGGDIPG
jgi:hypothetical protein